MKFSVSIFFILAWSVVAVGQTDSALVQSSPDTLESEEAYSAITVRGWNDLNFRSVDSLMTVGSHGQLNEWNRDIYGQLPWANLASPLSFLVYQPNEAIGVRSGFESYFNGWRAAKEIPLYDVKAPLSGIRYLSGYQRGQLFGGYFTANAHERLNINFDYQRVSARGDYFSQDNLLDQINASTNYRTHNNQYHFQSAVAWNLNRGRESGGITNFPGFSDPDSVITDRELINVRLYNSEFKARQLDFALSQQYLPFSDSISMKGIGLYHDADFNLSNRTFTSTDSVYGNYFIDSVRTADSMHYAMTQQEVGLVFQSGLKSFTYAKAGVGYRYGQLSNDSILRSEGTIFLSTELRGEGKSYAWQADGEYYLVGTQAGAFDVRGRIEFDLGAFAFLGNARFQQQSPTLQSEEWYANDFIWSNDFQSTFYQKLGGTLRYSRYASLSVNLQNWSRPIYYNQSSLPTQLDGTVQLVQSELDLRVPVLSWLTITSRTTLQLTSGPEDVLRLPTLVNRSGIFAEWEIAGGALKAYTGVEALSFSSYQANRYNPATGTFYLQDERSIGNFLYLNGVAGFKISSAQIYVIAENAAEGLLNRAYFAAPYYPLADRTIHLGVRWRFFN
ncbi:MAG: hypothetical protein HWD92_11455 [Flavobacteriia bacterium]|nr:hypothetical protein [Flavobacteriia bacterium]